MKAFQINNDYRCASTAHASDFSSLLDATQTPRHVDVLTAPCKLIKASIKPVLHEGLDMRNSCTVIATGNPFRMIGREFVHHCIKVDTCDGVTLDNPKILLTVFVATFEPLLAILADDPIQVTDVGTEPPNCRRLQNVLTFHPAQTVHEAPLHNLTVVVVPKQIRHGLTEMESPLLSDRAPAPF